MGHLIDEVHADQEPVLITGKRANAVLVSEKEWNSLQETLCLVSIPEMRESIREGLQTSPDEMSETIDWND